jgi:hypothetical protein
MIHQSKSKQYIHVTGRWHKLSTSPNIVRAVKRSYISNLTENGWRRLALPDRNRSELKDDKSILVHQQQAVAFYI